MIWLFHSPTEKLYCLKYTIAGGILFLLLIGLLVVLFYILWLLLLLFLILFHYCQSMDCALSDVLDKILQQ